MDARAVGQTQITAAAKAGFSERSGRRIEAGKHQMKKGQLRDWRTREDPIARVWEEELKPQLEREPRLEAMTLYEYLQERYPGKYERNLRTVQRRVSEWKAQHGIPPEVMFELRHTPGEMGFSDFTELKGVSVTIGGQPFEHLLYHYRLAYSGWQYVQIVQGGESYVALAEGLQNALSASGGVPRWHRSDSLSAAYHNSGGKHRLTERYEALCRHYQMRSSRNNTGIAHENGSIEGSHGYFKRRLVQQLYLRDSVDFASVEEYAQFIRDLVEKLNAKCQEKFTLEQQQLQPLPPYRMADYDILTVRVTTRSTVDIKSVLYTVPEGLIGRQLTVHLYHNRWVGYLGQQVVLELPRQSAPAGHTGKRLRVIHYRHLIQGLRKKPRVLLYCSWTNEILPNDTYRAIWQQLLSHYERDSAARLMVEALYIAATQDKEAAVAEYLQSQLKSGGLSIGGLQQYFQLQAVPPAPEITVQQHSLSIYDLLLHHDNLSFPDLPSPDSLPLSAAGVAVEPLRESQPSSQKPEVVPHGEPLATPGATSDCRTLELCPVPVGALGVGSDSSLSGPDCARHQRGATASGQVPHQLRVCPLPDAQTPRGDATGSGFTVDQPGGQLSHFWSLRNRENAFSHCDLPFYPGVGQTSQVLFGHDIGADPPASQAQSDLAQPAQQVRPL